MRAILAHGTDKWKCIYEMALEIMKIPNLEEPIGIDATQSVRSRDEPIHIYLDGYAHGMATAIALIEMGIIDIESLEVKLPEADSPEGED